MKKTLLLFVALFPLFPLLCAQQLAPTGVPLAGTYIIGSTQPAPFNNLTNAVTEINNSGVSGPVVFLLNDAIYSTGETFPIKIDQFQGTSTVNTLTIKPNTGKTVTITGTNINGYTALPAVFQIDGGDNIVIDGSNTSNGRSRDLTIVNNDNVPYAARTAVWISSNAANGATNIKVLNVKLRMANRNQDALQLSGIFSGSNSRDGSNGVSGTPATAANSNFTVKNNEFLNVRQGIIINGNTKASLQTSNVEFSSNKLGSAVDGEKPLSPLSFKNIKTLNIVDNNINGGLNNSTGNSTFTGIEIENSSPFALKRNTLTGMKMTLNNLTAYGIRISGLSTNGVVSENKISDLKNTGAGRLRAIQLDLSSNTTGLLLANNFISDVAVNTNSINDSDNAAHGIYITNGNGIRIYHNTVAMNSSPAGWSSAIYFAGGTAFDVQNNIFTNTLQQNTGKNYAIYSALAKEAFLKINNNNYFSSSAAYGFLGNEIQNITAWKAATGKDVGSLQISPVYVSTTDLHLQAIPANVGLANAGADLLAAVPIDIDGQARTSTPEIGADEFSIAATLAPEPTTSSTALTFSNVTANSFNLSWTNGNGANRIVVIRSGSAVDSAPVDATAYTANATFGSGSQIGTGNYVVYGGTSNTVTVTGLSSATTYYVSVYEYNGDGATANYLTTLPLTGNQKTLNANLGWQIFNLNTLNKITFDTTVSGVNNGSFAGIGFSPAPTTGQLNSNSWSLAGFEDGAIAFGGINTNPDFGHGIATGNVTEGGIYAFKTSANNAALGVQPSAKDFVPGNISLRFQNQTSAPLTSISIGYKVYVYNDEAGASSFNFSHSADNSAYTAIPELNVISPAEADVSPLWKASYRVATITGLNILPNQFYYLKWTGDKITPIGPYDQFGLDDIVLSANPSTVFADFNGTAENFSIHGNTSLSGNTTVNGDLKFTAGTLSIGSNLLTIGGTVTNTIAGGLKGSATSNISIIGAGNKTLSFDQTTPGSTNLLNNLAIPFAAIANNNVLISNEVAIDNSLTVGLNQTLNLGTNQLKGNLSTITIDGSMLTQNSDESENPFPAGKTWGGTGILHLNAETTPQKLVAGTYTNLTLSSKGGTTANASVTVNGILDLPSANPSTIAGSLSMTDPFVLTMGPDGTNKGLGDVTGIIQRDYQLVPNKLYTFGHKYSSILFPDVGTLPQWMKVKVVIGTNNWRPGAVKRYYDITQSGAQNTKAIIREHYLDSELNGNIESKLVNWGYKLGQANSDFEQGRSNINTEENWVEITNANIGLFFQNTFDKVYIALDQTEASVLTWNGEKGNAWNTIGNWTKSDGTKLSTPSFETKVIIPNVSPNPQPILNPNTQVLAVEIEASGSINASPDDVFEIYGTSGAWINNGGTFNAPSGVGKVIFKTLDATISGRTTFNNLEIGANASLRALEGNYMGISGNLVNNGLMSVALLPNTIEFVGANQIIPLPGGQDRNGYHHLTISGTNTVFPLNLNVRGNLTLNQVADLAGKTINLTGDTKQMIGGTAAIIFNNLTVNKETGAVVLANDITVAGTLTLQKGNLIIDDKNLTLGQNAVAGTFSATNMIVADGTGFVRRPFSSTGFYFFPIGEMTSNPAYSPISVNITGGSFSDGYVSVSVVDAIHPNNNSSQNYISRYWNVKQTGISNAVATIEAHYVAAELLAPAETMIAAQLTGVFSAETNPWKRFAPLSGLTLTAAGATLTNEVSVFTGIKGGDFTAVISGGETTCEETPVTLTAEVTGGDMPYTYLWSSESEPNLGTEATLVPEKFIGTEKYTLTMIDANGRKTTADKTVTTVASAVAGTLSGAQTVCFAYTPMEDIKLSGNSADVLYWQRSEEPQFLNPIKIANETTTLSGAEAGQITGVTYFRAAIDNGSCPDIFTPAIELNNKTTIWIDGAWDNGAPDSTTAAVITVNYNEAATITACSLTVIACDVTIPAGYDVIINGALIVDNATFTLKSDTNLVQTSNEQNYGNITVERESSKLFRLDYTMWGSPVTGPQTLKQFSPKTLSNRFYNYNSGTNLFATVVPTTTTFTPGEGYLIRMPDDHIKYGPAVTPLSWLGSYRGIPTTGPVTIALDLAGEGYNMIANPYASKISATKFLTNNIAAINGTLYFWRRRNDVPAGTEGTNAYYATYTSAGGAGVSSNSTFQGQPFTSEIPNGFIQVGQGFLVQKKTNATTGNVIFTNTMRTAGADDNQFFRTANADDRSRIWLNITNAAGEFGQTLVAYMPEAENGVDRTDGKYLNDGTTALTSWLDNSEYIIQGRAPFIPSDIVALNFRTVKAGNYTIAIDHVDGLFEGNQDIYLRDKAVGITHNLKASVYTFTTTGGTFNSRFELVYENGTLVVDNPTFDSSSVVLYKKDGDLTVKSKGTILQQVEVFDFAGRLLATAKNIKANEVSMKINDVNQVLIVKITSTDGRIISKKIIN